MRLAQANTVSKNDTANLLSKSDFVDKLKSLNKLSEKVKLLSSSWNVIYKRWWIWKYICLSTNIYYVKI